MNKQSSDDIVESLQPYGVVNIFQSSDKMFSARCELLMHGMSSEVKSGYKYPSMNAALVELQARVFKVLNVDDSKLKLVEQ